MNEDGTPFGRYRLIELLGRGGMGEEVERRFLVRVRGVQRGQHGRAPATRDDHFDAPLGHVSVAMTRSRPPRCRAGAAPGRTGGSWCPR